MFVLDDILLAPFNLVSWIGEKLRESAEAEITDESRVHEEILELQMRYEMDEITEEEYEKREARLMERLEDIRTYKEERKG